LEVHERALAAGVPATIKKTGMKSTWTDAAVETYVESARTYHKKLRRLDG
jgi:hypothetical protein